MSTLPNRTPIESNAIGTNPDLTNYAFNCYNCYKIKGMMLNNNSIINDTLSGIAIPNIIERNGIYINNTNKTHPKIDFLQKLTIDDAQHSRWCQECGVLVDHRLYLKSVSASSNNFIDISITFFKDEKLPKKIKIKLPSTVQLKQTTDNHQWLKYELYELKETKNVSADFSSIDGVGAMSVSNNSFSIVFTDTPTFTKQTTFTLRLKSTNVENLNNVDEYDVIQMATYETEDNDDYLSGFVGFVELSSYNSNHNITNDIDNVFGIPENQLIILTRNVLYGWGSNGWGQLGTGKNLNVEKPTYSLFTNPIKVSIKKDFTLGIDKEGYLYSWGHNQYGQLSFPGDRNPHPTPTKILNPLGVGVAKIIEIQTGWFHSLALDSNKKVWAVGRNQKGQLGVGQTTPKTTKSDIFVKVKKIGGDELEGIVMISTTSDFNLALDVNGEVWKWGNGSDLARKTMTYNLATTTDNFIFNNIKEIATGSYHALALDNSGNVYGLGYNFSGQLGIGSSGDQINFQDENKEEYVKWITTSATNIKKIASGEEHSVAITNAKKALVWGDNRFGQIGDGKYTIEPKMNNNRYSPYTIGRSLYLISKTTVSKTGEWEVEIPKNLKLDANNYDVKIYINGFNGDSKSLTYPLQVLLSGTDEKTTSDASTQIDEANPIGVTLSKDNVTKTTNQTPKIFGTSTNTVENDIVYVMFYLNSFDNVSNIVCGPRNTVAIKEDGTVWAWGQNPSNIFFVGEDKLLYPTRIRELEGKEQIIIGDGSIFYIQKEALT